MGASASNATDRKASLIPLGNGLYRVSGMIRSAVTGRYLTEPLPRKKVSDDSLPPDERKQDLPKGW